VRRSEIKDKSKKTKPSPSENKSDPPKTVAPVSKENFTFIPAMEGMKVANRTEQRATPKRESQMMISF
jgi:hypothetical protein